MVYPGKQDARIHNLVSKSLTTNRVVIAHSGNVLWYNAPPKYVTFQTLKAAAAGKNLTNQSYMNVHSLYNKRKNGNV